MSEEQLRLYLIFTNIKMHMYGKQSTLSHKKKTVSLPVVIIHSSKYF